MKFMKKIAVFLLTLMVCFSIVPSNVSAAGTATAAKPGKAYSMYLTDNNDSKNYKITLKRAQRIDFTLTTTGSYCNYGYFKIYNSNGEQIRNEFIEEDNDIGKKKVTYTDYLNRGEYTLVFTSSYNNLGKLTWSYTAKNISKITQSNHSTFAKAPTCGFRKYYFDNLGSSNAKNIVKFNVPATGTYEMKLTSTVATYMHYTFYNSKYTEVYRNQYIYVNREIGKVTDTKNIALKKGTYYVSFVSGYQNYYNGVYKWMMRRIR